MNHFIRTQLVWHLFEEFDLKRKDGISKEAHPYRIRKDKQLSEISEFFALCNNPFDEDSSPPLFNLCTGKAASKETQPFLLNIR